LREELVAIARRAIAEVNGERLVARALAPSTVAAPGSSTAAAPGSSTVAAPGSSTVAAPAFSTVAAPASATAEVVWAVGKAAVAMACGAGARRGIVVTKAGGSDGAPAGVELYEAGHPIPDERSAAATEALLAAADRLGPGEHALLLLSGGTSALVGGPLPGVALSTVQAATRALVAGGAPIGEINTVRRHLGAVLGGRLAVRARGTIEVLALSDVVGDDPAAIGSGPASPDPTTLADALAVAHRRGLPPELVRALHAVPETPKPGDPAFARVRYRILASPPSLREAAGRIARAAGFAVDSRADLVEGDVEVVAAELLGRARRLGPGELHLAVGEPTVQVRGEGAGGRAQHLALLVARGLAGGELAFAACGSDGTDGPTPVAGAAVDGTTWPNAAARGLDPEAALARADSHALLSVMGQTIFTGPTGTNLTDLLLLARGA
jgi:hydroxypyruvate reductase